MTVSDLIIELQEMDMPNADVKILIPHDLWFYSVAEVYTDNSDEVKIAAEPKFEAREGI